jgi:hypothetical protein
VKLVFCGTPRFAVPTLEALLAAGHEIALVVTQPDRPVGRKQQLAAPPVKQTALAAGLAVTQPEKIRNNAGVSRAAGAIAPDAIVVVAYGRIIPPWMLALYRAWGASICTARCCPSIAAQRLSNGPWPWAKPSPATPPCCWKKASIPAHFVAAASPHQARTRPRRTSLMCWPRPARRWWSRPWPAWPDGTVHPQPQDSTLWPRSLRCSPRRRAHGFCNAHSGGVEESLARLSALARCVYLPRRQKADRSSHGCG